MYSSALQACRDDLYTSRDELMLRYPLKTVEKVLRVREMHQWCIANPDKRDREFVEECVSRFKVSQPVAYSDLRIIKDLLPTLAQTSREYARWKYNEMILDTYNAAKKAEDYKTMERAATSYAKFNRVDVEDEKQLPLDMIVVQQFVPTMDPTVIGIKPIPNLEARQKALIEKYSRESIDIEDIGYEDADLEEDSLFPEKSPNDGKPTE